MLTEEKDLEAIREEIRKAVINGSTLPNVILNRVQTDRFIDDVVNESSLLKRVRIARRREPSGELNRLYFSGPVTEHAALSHTERAPSEAVVNYDTVKLRSSFDLASDFMEDIKAASPEAARKAIAQLFASQISNDLEDLSIRGDSTISTSVSATDRLRKANNGWSALLTAALPTAQDIDAAGAGASKKLYYEMLRKLPSKYKRTKGRYVWVAAPAIVEDWIYTMSERATPAGDKAIEGIVTKPFGVPFAETPLMPVDQTYGTGVTDATEIWLVDPRNLVMVVQREVKWEWERNPRSDVWEATIHTRCDYIIENENAIVRAKNVSLTGTAYTG